jgi:class 3 adenylate cyclase
MVGYNFELSWYNESARQRILGFEAPPQSTESRNIFGLLPKAADAMSSQRRNELLRLYVSLGRQHLSKASLLGIVGKLDREVAESIDELYEKTDRMTRTIIVNLPCVFSGENGTAEAWRVYGIYFREGILVIHVPEEVVDPSLLEIVSRRDAVLHNLMTRQLPVFTPLLVLEAGLAGSAAIRAELAPDEYFQLIEEVWAAMAPIFRKYYGAYGKYCGDGVRYYFLPRPDSNYILNGKACERELKQQMRKISIRWQLCKNWLNDLCLNVRLEKGQEWLGNLQSEANVEFPVRGGAFNIAAGVSDAAGADVVRGIKTRSNKIGTKDGAHSSLTPRGAGQATEKPTLWRYLYHPDRSSSRVPDAINCAALQGC